MLVRRPSLPLQLPGASRQLQPVDLGPAVPASQRYRSGDDAGKLPWQQGCCAGRASGPAGWRARVAGRAMRCTHMQAAVRRPVCCRQPSLRSRPKLSRRVCMAVLPQEVLNSWFPIKIVNDSFEQSLCPVSLNLIATGGAQQLVPVGSPGRLQLGQLAGVWAILV